MALQGMNNGQAKGSEGGEQMLEGGDDGLEAGDIVTQGFSKTAGFQKISLHIDNDQGQAIGILGQRVGVRTGLNIDHA